MSTPIEQNTASLEHLLEIATSLPDADGGSGGSTALPDGVTAIASGTFTPASDMNSVSVSHGLGAIPSFWVIVPESGGFTVGDNAGYIHNIVVVLKPFTVGSSINPGRYAVSYASSTGSIMSGSATTVGSGITATGVEFTAYSGSSAKFKGGVTYRWVACVGTDFT